MTSLFTSVILCKEIYVVKTEKRRDKVTQQRMRSLDASFYHFPIRKSWPIRHMFRLQCTLSFIYIMLATKERNVQRTNRPYVDVSFQGTKRLGNETSCYRISRSAFLLRLARVLLGLYCRRRTQGGD